MHFWIALSLLQAAAPAAPIDLKCTSVGASPAISLAFHIDLPKESFSVARNGGAALTGTALSYSNTVVLELPSDDPGAIPMFFLDMDKNTYAEVSRSGASAMTPVSDGTCAKTAP